MALNEQTVSFKDTLNLPRTDFPIRPNAVLDDPAMIVRWETNGLYAKAFNAHAPAQKYVLHVGPPFSNGHIHLGHAYNGTLKDIITKAHRMAGYHVPVTPGWDCHGLPIEINVAQSGKALTRLEMKKACRDYAQHWVDVQRSEFKRLGILMDWDRPYLTMSPAYEGAVVRGFGEFYKQGYIQRKNKSVPWCFSCKTVLAAAEIEYKDRKDPSIYVLFPFAQEISARLFPEAQGQEVSLLIWTTTPWTLPLNRAVILKSHAEYVLAELNGSLIIVGAQTLPLLEKTMQQTARVIKKFTAEYLKDQFVQHPFVERQTPLFFEDAVALDEGTACVHCAPGCGQIDYEWGIKHNLEIFSPLSDDGRYEVDIEPAHLVGTIITDAQGQVISLLAERKRLFHKGSITHSYPHCWRCRNGLMYRATKQWFLNLEHENLRKRALEAIETITFNPPQGKNFLRATVSSRLEWCISRQRVWGIPIPALLCKSCNAAYITPEFIEKVARAIEAEGIEYWDRVSVEELAEGIVCPACKRSEFNKELDILDVWFESGSSHYAVLYNNPELQFPADLYLEGIDQHRGWFQSSLLTGMVLEGKAPMTGIMTHGFTVDEKGQKMSKSLGNVVAPNDVITKLGTDGLRLWVASVGNEGDAMYSETIFNHVGEVFRKIRNTTRFLLANLYDYEHERDAVSYEDMFILERSVLALTRELNDNVIAAYKEGDMSAVFHALGDFCTVELSSGFLDIIKDRLYVEQPDGYARRSAQTVCYYILDVLTRLMAPVMSFTAEQVSDLYQKNKTESIHLQCFAQVPDAWRTFGELTESDKVRNYIRSVRSAVLKAIELEREKNAIKHSLEARVTFYVDPTSADAKLYNAFVEAVKKSQQTVENFFREYFIASQVVFATSKDGLGATNVSGVFVHIEHAHGVKCPRCWNWDETTHEHNLCRRCQPIVAHLKA